jgi:tetratricopeptide (TPR) repeat protein
MPGLVELDEIVGYHLEQSTRYRLELGALTGHEVDVAARAAERLQVAGERALLRRDVRASANLLGRGLALLPPEKRAIERQWKLILSLMEGGELVRARKQADEDATRAAVEGDRRGELYGRLALSFVTFSGTPEDQSMDALRQLAAEARVEFEATHDELGVGLSWYALAHVHHNGCRWQDRHEALEQAHLHAVSAQDDYLRDQSLLWMAAGPVYGPTPTDEGLRWFDEYEDLIPNTSLVTTLRAVVEAMVGNFDRARELIRDATSRLEELGQQLWLAGIGLHTCAIEMLAGDPEAAAREGIKSSAALEAIGERGWLSTLAGQTAQALMEVGRDDEAEHWIDVADRIGGPDDVITQTQIRQVRAKLLSRRGLHVEAVALAHEAVELVGTTDMLEGIANAKIDLAEVLRASGMDAEALKALEEAEALFERKRHLVGIARTRALAEAARAGV